MVDFFAYVLKIFNAKMQEPRAFGLFHLSFFALSVLLGFFLCRAKPSPNEKFVKKVLLITSLVVIALEIYKQIVFSFTYFEGEIRFIYAWQFFPFQFCSTPMYAGLFAALTKSKKIHNALCAFLSSYSFAAGIGVMLFPQEVFTNIIGINVQTMVCHGSMVTVGIFLLCSGYVPANKKTFLRAMPIFIVLVLWAVTLNELVFKSGILNGQTFNMFFISPYFKASLPIYAEIFQWLPFPLGVMGYAFLFTLGAYVVLSVVTFLTQFVLKKTNSRDILNTT